MNKAEEILDKYYQPKMHWQTVNRKEVLKAMEEYAASSIPSNGEWISVEKDADYDGEYYGYIKRTEECGAVNEIQRVVVNRYNKWILEANEELLYYMPLFAKPIK